MHFKNYFSIFLNLGKSYCAGNIIIMRERERATHRINATNKLILRKSTSLYERMLHREITIL